MFQGLGFTPPRSDKGTLFQALGSLGGVAAALAGVLYLLGLIIETRVLQHAGLSVRDVLPLFPLEQILRTGLTVVLPALGILIVILATIFVAWRYEEWLRTLSADFVRDEKPGRPDDAELEAAHVEAQRRHDWMPMKKQVRAARVKALEAGETERAKQLKKTYWAFLVFDVFGVVIFAASLLAFAFLPAAIAVPCIVVVAVMWVVTSTIWKRTFEQQLMIYYLILVLAIIATFIAYPRPLAKTSIVPGGVSGNLIVISESTWHLALEDGRVLSIPATHIDCARIEPQRRNAKSLWRQLLGIDEPNNTLPPKLKCD